LSKQRLRILLVKPSRYDDDGYVIQWVRNLVPAQTLAVLNGILHQANQDKLLGDVIIEVRILDESATVIRSKRELTWLRQAERCALFLAGVQTNQYPRAVDLARPFIAENIPILLGGFHVSGVVAMTPDWQQGLQAARDLGISLYAGELEEGIQEVLIDLWQECLKPLYNHLSQLPNLEQSPAPRLDEYTTSQTMRRMAGMDLGRGCPYLCSFCTIINVQGRRPRQRSAQAAADYVRHCARHGVYDFIVSDDNFARNQNWEPILDALIDLRENEQLPLDLFIQVDVLAATIPRFVDKAVRAGCRRVFIGVESIRDDNLLEMQKKQNQKVALKDVVLRWKQAGAIVYAGYMIGLPNDTPQRVMEDIKLLQEQIPIDLINFFISTPLPGSADHQRLLNSGFAMDDDLNRYDTEHPVSTPKQMTRDELQQLYWQVWEQYYTPEHIARLLKRAIAFKLPVKELFKSVLGFYAAIHYDKVHPLQSGMLRRKVRTSRRVGMPIISIWGFYPKRFLEILQVQSGLIRFSFRMYRLLWRTQREMKHQNYHESFLDKESSL